MPASAFTISPSAQKEPRVAVRRVFLFTPADELGLPTLDVPEELSDEPALAAHPGRR